MRFQVLGKVNERQQLLASEAQLRSSFASEEVKREVIILLEAVAGIAEASRLYTVQLLFSFIQPMLEYGALLIGRYRSRTLQKP